MAHTSHTVFLGCTYLERPPLGIRERLEHIIFKRSSDSKVGMGRNGRGNVLNIRGSMCKGLEVKGHDSSSSSTQVL